MAEDTTFNVPVSSYGELKKIMKAYAHADKKISLTEASKLTGMGTTVISGSSRFLVHLGILGSGANKQITEFGKRLGRALEHNQEADVRRLLAEAVTASPFLSNVVSSIRIKGGITEDDLASHILYVAGQKSTGGTRTGSRAIIEILKESGVVTDAAGTFTVSTAPTPAPVKTQKPDEREEKEKEKEKEKEEEEEEEEDDEDKDEDEDAAKRRGKGRVLSKQHPNRPNITINISLELPDTADAQVYENFFKAMKTHLFADE